MLGIQTIFIISVLKLSLADMSHEKCFHDVQKKHRVLISVEALNSLCLEKNKMIKLSFRKRRLR